jgi:hypothetical protein
MKQHLVPPTAHSIKITISVTRNTLQGITSTTQPSLSRKENRRYWCAPWLSTGNRRFHDKLYLKRKKAPAGVGAFCNLALSLGEQPGISGCSGATRTARAVCSAYVCF